MLGKTILHYKIIAKLGEGGMGVVCKAEDTKLKREVAIKFLPRQLASSDEERERFKIEAQAAAALNHANIATIHNIEEVDDETFIVMEYVRGTELADRIGPDQLSIDETLDLAIQIAEGLQIAHDAGVIHRDIKPANIMLTDKGQVKITDFGLAKVRGGSQVTKIGTTLGTAAYMSPEQARGDASDQRSDIWAFGVLLYEMLSGEQPFKGNYEQAVIYTILNEEPVPISQLRRDVPEKLGAVLTKSLQKETAQRYQSMREILTDLKDIRGTGPDSSATTEKAVPSIAVLPFVNQSADPENEYFSDGLAEEIINALSRLKHLQVAARTSAFSFKGKDTDIREIARKLGVESVLEGSVRKAGNRVRVTAQLIKASDGYQLWSERFDREMDDIFAIQDEISLAIIAGLKVQLLGQEKEAVVERGTESLAAYELYLKGRYYWNQRGEGLRKGLEYFQQAAAADPGYALAHAGLADAYALLGFYGALPPRDAMPKAKASAAQAIELDAAMAEAHSTLGFVTTFYDWDWPSAKRQFQKALALDPRCVTAHYWYALYLSWVEGKLDEGLVQARRAAEIDPLGINPLLMVALILAQQDQYAESITELQKAIKLDPTSWLAHRYLGVCYRAQGKHTEAIHAAENAVTFSGRHQWTLVDLGACYVAAGMTDKALVLQEELSALSRSRYVSPVVSALLALELKQIDEAMAYFDQAVADRDGSLIAARYWPVGFPIIHDDPRYEALLKKIGLL